MSPLALDPEATFQVVLRSDKFKELEEQPYFEFKFISGAQCRRVSSDRDKLPESETGDELLDKLYEIVARYMVGWGNMIDPGTGAQIPYDPKALENIIHPTEAQELIDSLLTQGLEVRDLKNSELPLESSTGKSAKAVKGPGNAKKNQRRNSRSEQNAPDAAGGDAKNAK